MLQKLENILEELQRKRVDVLNQNVDALVEERVRAFAEEVRNQVVRDIEQEASILEIKAEAISDAIQVVRASEAVKEIAETTPVTDDTQY